MRQAATGGASRERRMSTPDDCGRPAVSPGRRFSGSALQATVVAGLLVLGAWFATGALREEPPAYLKPPPAAAAAALPAASAVLSAPEVEQGGASVRPTRQGNAA